ncbi:kinase-like domain-containing protein, partial [Polychytrium aggregatum]|uniref:kinase-like domain-containing protein n=1 Tax=Polychytrium aggregatum TaxID=110093 RepID=UPI0022FE8F1A
SAKPICSGGFGDVYTATYFGTRVAVKQLRCSCLEQEIGEFRREIRVWHQLSHNHILPLRGACDTVEKLFMVSPFMENSTLKSYL